MFSSALGNLALVAGVVVSIGAIHLINEYSGGQLRQLGILPRSSEHWLNILSAPFIHGSFAHFASNAVGLLVFGGLAALRSKALFIGGSLFIIIVGGGLVWAFGRPALHIGASGWIYGLWALTISIAWFDRKIVNVIIALLVVLFFGGMSYGLLPMQRAVSFEMHIAGALAGALCGFVYIQIVKPEN